MTFDRCEICKFFTTYYERLNCYYQHTCYGYCNKFKKFSQANAYCKVFEQAIIRNRNTKSVVLSEMRDIITKINIIKDFIENK